MSTPDHTVPRRSSPDSAGELIEPGDAGYDDARAVYNAMIDRRPGADRALRRRRRRRARRSRFAREHDLLIAIRGGGHNGAGLGHRRRRRRHRPLRAASDIRVDPQARTVRVGGGCTWGEVDRATGEHGLATPSGIISTTGVGGLTLGGGLGHLTRAFGLTIDNLLEADVVLADGRVGARERRRAPRPVLGAARRRRQLRRRHLVRVPAARGRHDLRRPDVLGRSSTARRCCPPTASSCPSAPRALNGFFAFHTVPPGPPFPEAIHLREVCGVVWCYVGGEADAAAAMAPLLDSLPEPLLHGVGADAARRAAGRVRRALPARRAVVLARGLRQRGPRRGRARCTRASAPRCRR